MESVICHVCEAAIECLVIDVWNVCKRCAGFAVRMLKSTVRQGQLIKDTEKCKEEFMNSMREYHGDVDITDDLVKNKKK